MTDMHTVRTTVPIFFTIDESYAPYMGVALHSIMQGASPDFDYEVVVMHEGLSDESVARLAQIASARPDFTLRFVPMEGQIEGITNRHSNKLRQDYFTLTIFFRLFIAEMFPEYDKGIYIDSDVVVPGDISELYSMELGDDLIGACRDLSIHGIPELVDYTDRGVGVGIDSYINSGVLLLNLKALRACSFERRFLELLTRYNFENIAPDQDYLNVLCHGRITYLDPSWDAMPTEGVPPMPRPNLVHYNLFSKPWCYDDVAYGEYFWRYAEETPFIDDVRRAKREYGEGQKASDRACMGQLISHAKEIAEAPFNFRTAFESGLIERL